MKRTIGRPAVLLSLVLLASLAAGAQDAQKLLEEYGTVITVYGERLPLGERQILDAPATVSVVTREQIEASGAKTVQEVLSLLPSVFLHDQTGNPSESTVDVRGFPQGTSLAVFLDGVRLNDVQDNSVRWETIPIEDVERIEVYRGACGPLYGGGALAGVVNVITRHNAGIPRVDLKAGAGSFAEREARLHTSGSVRDLEFYATAMRRRSQGWRENDGYDLDDGLFRLNYRPEEGQEAYFLVKYAGGTESDPGALTAQEMREDPRQDPYNLHDGSRGAQRLFSAGYSAKAGGGWTLSAQAYDRTSDRDTLTTGRSGTGFFTSGSEGLSGITAQASYAWQKEKWSVDASAGAELSRGTFDGKGYFTDIYGAHKSLASQTSVDEDLSGAFVQGDVGRGAFHVIVGARADRASYGYADALVPANDTDRVFRESTGRLGLLYHTGPWSSVFVTYSQGFKIPSVLDLFAYPGFYSNPDLVPTRADDWEAGWRYLKDGWRVKVSAFDMKLRDEVVYFLTNPQLFIGQNQNVGRSYRRGVETEANIPLPKGFSLFASGSYMESGITAGPYAGKQVPMVPRAQGTAGAGWSNPDWTVRLAATWVGPQVLDNDLANARPRLAGSAVVGISARYVYRALTLEASVENLLDKRYASRGVTNGFQDYFTPSYPRTLRFAATWSF